MTYQAVGAVAPANEEAVRAWDTVLYERWKKNRKVFVGALDEITEELFERFPPPEGARCIDIGCGFGETTQRLAQLVGPEGFVLGTDSSPHFVEDARREAAEAGVENVEFVKGYIEEMPLPDASVDVVISNCVINLSADKVAVLREVSRVLRPGGRFAVSDVIADPDMDEATKADMDQWTGCIAGALTESEFRAALEAAGFVDVEIRETHRVHEHAGSAIVRARKP